MPILKIDGDYNRQLGEMIERALAFIRSSQLPHGEFPGYRYDDRELTSKATLDSSPFVTTFALNTFRHLAPTVEQDAKDKAINFLLEERETPGLWRYWSSRNSATIEPDMDVTCCAAHALKQLAPDRHTHDADPILLANQTLRGLFKTWLRAPDEPNDIGSAVNANVALYFGDREETRSAIDYLNRLINESGEEGSDWYYEEPISLYYMISRAYAAGVTRLSECMPAIITKIAALQNDDGSHGNELLTAMALSTLLNAGENIDESATRAIQYLIDTQSANGSWPARAFYAGPEPPGPHTYWWGSDTLTTVMCLEAIARIAAS